MNITLFAVIGVIILIIALLVLKKITAGKKDISQDVLTEQLPEESAEKPEPAELAEPAEQTVEAAVPAEAVPEEIQPPPEEVVERAAEEEQVAAEAAEIEPDSTTELSEEIVRPIEEPIPAEIEETITAEQPEAVELAAEEPVADEKDEAEVAEETGEETPKGTPAAAIDFTIEQYAARLNHKEESHRQAVAEAIKNGEDKTRDALQLELVAINDKLALLQDSYQEACSCYQDVQTLLNRLKPEFDAAAVEAAEKDLVAGKPDKAEALLAPLAEQPGTHQALAAFHSARLAACRFDLSTAFERYRKATAADPENYTYLHPAGLTAKQMYKYPQAIAWLNSCIQAGKDTGAINPVTLAGIKRDLAYTYVVAGQSQKAGPLYKEAMTVLTEALGQEHPEMATCWYQIGELQETMGEYDKAVSLYKKALAILDKAKGREHPSLAPVLAKLAALCMELELEKEAVPLYEQLVAIREATLPPTHPQLAMSLNSLAESYKLQGQYPEAEACYLKTLAIAETTQGENSPGVGAILQELAKLCQNQRKKEEADEYQARATAIFTKVVEEQEKQSQDNSLTLEL